MPPIHNKNQSNSQEQEGRIQLALSDLKNEKIRSIRQAADVYNVSRSTLQNRLNGKAYRVELRANNHKLTKFEEESLVKWILDLDTRGLPPRPSMVRDMANYLLSQHGDQQVGEKWVYNLIQRRSEIKSRFSRRYNYERAKCEEPKIIQEYFNCVQAAILKHSIRCASERGAGTRVRPTAGRRGSRIPR